MRQQCIFLSLDEVALLALKARVLGFSDLIQHLAQTLHDVELIEQGSRLRDVAVDLKNQCVHHGQREKTFVPTPGLR